MANISAVKIVKHVVTQAESDAFGVNVPILWDSPFYDTDYVITATMEMPNFAITGDYGFTPLTLQSVTPYGCNVNATFGSAMVGQTIKIHAMASHK